jgi:hypothetical protein
MDDAAKRRREEASPGSDGAQRMRVGHDLHAASPATERDAGGAAHAEEATAKHAAHGGTHAAALAVEQAPAALAPAVSTPQLRALDDVALQLFRWRADDFEQVREKELGKGTFGIVVLMRRRDAAPDTAPVAVKRAHERHQQYALENDPDLMRELAVYTRLAKGLITDEEGWCPLVSFLGVFTSPRLSLVLEYYGVGLHTVLGKQPPDFDVTARLRVARHVAAAIRYLHEVRTDGSKRGIVHRDVKPANVLVDAAKGYAAKLTDLGTCRLMAGIEANNTLGEPRGTPAFMAPEVARGAPVEHPTALDTWSYGVLLYELFSGRQPNLWFTQHAAYKAERERGAKGCRATVAAVRAGAVPLLPMDATVPERIAALQPRCCAAAAGERPSFAIICAALQRTRARLTVRYSPAVERGGVCTVHMALHLDDASTPLVVQDEVDSGDCMLRYDFLVPAREGEQCAVKLAPVTAADGWMGSDGCELGLPLGPLQPGEAPVRTATLQVNPNWLRCPDAGHRSAVKITYERRTPPPAPSPASPVPLAPSRSHDGGQWHSSSLGSLTLRLAPVPSARSLLPSASVVRRTAAARSADIMLSYRCTETGHKGNHFTLDELQPALEHAGYTVFCYARRLRAGDAWVSVLDDGIRTCKAFIPVCSPTYAGLHESPWTNNELFQALRTSAQGSGADAGRPFVLPLWFSGEYPPPDAAAMLVPLAGRRVPAGRECADAIITARGGIVGLADVVAELVAALVAAGVHPSSPPAHHAHNK